MNQRLRAQERLIRGLEANEAKQMALLDGLIEDMTSVTANARWVSVCSRHNE